MRALVFSLFCLLFTLVGCKKDQSENIDSASKEQPTEVEIKEDPAEKPKSVSMSYFITTTDNLRLRAAPNTEAEVLATLGKGQLLRYLEETGGNDLVTTINGKEVKDNWRKVIVTTLTERNGELGWIFGGAVQPIETLTKLMDDGRVTRSFKGLPGSEIAKFTDLEMPYYESVFKGYFSFTPVTKGRYLLDGPFTIRGEMAEVPEEFAGMLIYKDYQGSYKAGELDGKLFVVSKGYESVARGFIEFKDGKCIAGQLEEEGEGMKSKASEENMPECTFKYLSSKLVEEN